jgi:branched-chain amino acid transport system substrate-binding protein
MLPFSGPPAVAVNAPLVHSAMLAAIESCNAQGGLHGRKVKLYVEDNGYDVQRAIAAVRKLVEVDNVFAIVNANGTPQVNAALPFLEQRDVPVLHTLGSMDSWYTPVRRGLFGLSILFNDGTRALGRWVAADGYHRIVILYPDFPAISPEMAAHAQQAILAANPAAEAHLLQAQFGIRDGAFLADEVERFAPDAVIILVNWPELTALAHELRQRGKHIPLYSWAANVTQEIIGLAGEALEGMKGIAGTIVSPLENTPVVEEYRSALAQVAPGQAPEFVSLFTYGQMKVLLEALRRARGELTNDSLYEALHSLRNFATGILPLVTYGPERHLGVSQIHRMQLKSGAWKSAGAPMDIDQDRLK